MKEQFQQDTIEHLDFEPEKPKRGVTHLYDRNKTQPGDKAFCGHVSAVEPGSYHVKEYPYCEKCWAVYLIGLDKGWWGVL